MRRSLSLLALVFIHALFTIAVVVALLTAPSAQAQSCAPVTGLTPLGSGSVVLEYANADGAAPRWWCPANPPPGGDPSLRWWTMSGLTCLNADCWRVLPGAMTRVATASSPLAQLQAEVAAARRVPAPGTNEECAYKKLQYGACMAFHTASLGAPYPGPKSPAEAAQHCGGPPSCVPAPPTTAWRTPTSGTMAVYAIVNGKKASTATPGRTAPTNALCDCARFRADVVAAGNTATYCALAAGPNPATECTLCKQVTQ